MQNAKVLIMSKIHIIKYRHKKKLYYIYNGYKYWRIQRCKRLKI